MQTYCGSLGWWVWWPHGWWWCRKRDPWVGEMVGRTTGCPSSCSTSWFGQGWPGAVRWLWVVPMQMQFDLKYMVDFSPQVIWCSHYTVKLYPFILFTRLPCLVPRCSASLSAPGASEEDPGEESPAPEAAGPDAFLSLAVDGFWSASYLVKQIIRSSCNM